MDATGKIAGSTHPEGLSASMLEDLMAGRSLSLPKPFEYSVKRDGDDSGPAPLLDLLVRPSSSRNSSGTRSGRNSVAMKGGKLVWIISYLYGI
jgi:hypothetical protein